ncbi:MAG: ABC transporter ATP-binding protein [Magnetococcales bacterium]|nr:ABC transporter ATP-binding protein [Magnetococcales bacterium]
MTTRHSPLRRVLGDGWLMMTRRERRNAIILMLAAFTAGLIDIVALAGVMPLVSLVVEPELLHRNRWFMHLHRWLGHPSDATFIFTLTGGAITLLLASSGLKSAIEWATARFGASCEIRLSRQLTEAIVSAPYPWFLRQNSALLSRLAYSDVVMWGGRFLKPVIFLFGAGITLAWSLAFVLTFAAAAGLGAMAAVSVAAAVILLALRPRIHRLARIKREAADDVVLTMTQTLGGIKGVKLSSRESFFTRIYIERFSTMARAEAAMRVWQKAPPEILILFGQILLLSMGALLWSEGQSGGEIAAQMAMLVMVSSRIVPALNRITANIALLWEVHPFIEGIANLQREVNDELRLADQVRDKPALTGPWERLELREVQFHYAREGEAVLQNLSLTLERGGAYGVAGPSGSGKSTLVDLILGLLSPTGGHLMVDGKPLEGYDLKSWQRRIGYVPQQPFLLHDTVRANVAFGVPPEEVDDAWVRECLRLANLEELLNQLELGLDTVMGEHGSRLSGGQRQRVAIARAFYQRPEFLVLDEATSALDSRSESEVQQAIDNLQGRVTTLTIAHRLHTLKRCDVIFLLEDGRLRDQGSHDQLLGRNPLFRQMVGGGGREPRLKDAGVSGS